MVPGEERMLFNVLIRSINLDVNISDTYIYVPIGQFNASGCHEFTITSLNPVGTGNSTTGMFNITESLTESPTTESPTFSGSVGQAGSRPFIGEFLCMHGRVSLVPSGPLFSFECGGPGT